ncbi:MAG: HigA family addiction module antidote protein [Candidatus Obscuribacterales bacterium]|nr:HigA family addiction module antidote protein [Candidatus Obscuribacterales bacterium]
MLKQKTQYSPDFVTPPGETLQDKLDELGFSQRELADRMGRPRKTINEIIMGKAAITAETALQLELVLNIPAHFWLAREASYRASLAREDETERLSGQLDLLKKLPTRQMVDYKWIEDHKDKTKLLKEVLAFFGVTSEDRIPLVEQIAFRKSDKYKANPWALAAWLRRGEIEAASKFCCEYNRKAFQLVLSNIRGLTVLPPDEFVPKLVNACLSAGVVILFVRELQQTKVSGASRWIKGNPVIQLSLFYKADHHFWFTFFHEAMHVLKEHKKDEIFLEDEQSRSLDPLEIEANCLAQDLLIPEDSFAEFLSGGNFSDYSIAKFAKQIGIAPSLVAGRLRHDEVIDQSYGHKLTKQYTWDNWPEFC